MANPFATFRIYPNTIQNPSVLIIQLYTVESTLHHEIIGHRMIHVGLRSLRRAAIGLPILWAGSWLTYYGTSTLPPALPCPFPSPTFAPLAFRLHHSIACSLLTWDSIHRYTPPITYPSTQSNARGEDCWITRGSSGLYEGSYGG